jgi:hypothetical protein
VSSASSSSFAHAVAAARFSTSAHQPTPERLEYSGTPSPQHAGHFFLQTVAEHRKGEEWDHGLLEKVGSRMLPWVLSDVVTPAELVTLISALARSQQMHRKLIAAVLAQLRELLIRHSSSSSSSFSSSLSSAEPEQSLSADQVVQVA